MHTKLFESEAKVMEILWQNGPLPAKQATLIAADTLGWNKNTTYTVIKKLVAKGLIERGEPDFICTPLVTREAAQKAEAESLVERVFGGSRKALFSALIQDEKLTDDELYELKKLIESR